MTKKQAIEILNEACPEDGDRRVATNEREIAMTVIEALDRAGAFVSLDRANEIDMYARAILNEGATAGTRALRLATACRAAGLVKP